MSLSDADFLRYSRQVLLPEVGELGQMQLSRGHALIIGLGGLGHLVAHYLAAAGLGRLTLVDGDTIETSNLPRQLLFSDEDVGQSKALIAQQKLSVAYGACEISAITTAVTADSAAGIFAALPESASPAKIVIDCTDNFEARQLVNAHCISNRVALVSASVAHFQGQLLTVDLQSAPQAGCYHCLFPAAVQVRQNCQTVGVLGPMVGVMASMQALVSLQLLLGNNNLLGQLFRFDGANFTWRQASLSGDESCAVCVNNRGEINDLNHHK